MNRDEFGSLLSEIREIESLLAEIPKEDSIDRMGLEARLEMTKKAVAGVAPEYLPRRALLTFRGSPVLGSHGIAAEFAAKAASIFTDAFAAVVAENLRYMGRIPDKEKNQLLITGTALGSFGFEFELPAPEMPEDPAQRPLFTDPHKPDDAMAKLENLFQVSALGTDEEIGDLVDQLHPRAIKKVSEFLDYVSEQDAYCGLEFNTRFFRFESVEQIRTSADRLKSDNIKEFSETLTGEIQGVLPQGRLFEFKQLGTQTVIRGKVGPSIEDADGMGRAFLHKLVVVKFQVVQVGQARPRYSIEALDDINLPGTLTA